MGRKKKTDQEPTMPFGKHRGKTLAAVLREEPSYLCWLMEKVDGCEDIKKAIAGLPGFREEWEKHYERKHRRQAKTRQIVEETVRRMLGTGQEPDPDDAQALDDLCDWLFNAPAAEDAAKLRIVQGLHYGDYVQSGENLYCEKAGDEQYRFQVRDQTPPWREYEPWFVTPEADLSEVPLDILEQMDVQMSYCGEGDGDDRDAKFSETRKHIQRTMSQRSPS